MSTTGLINYDSGVATVGPNSGKSPVSVTAKFNVVFDSQPVVVATALQGKDYTGSIPDTFAVTITSISGTQFTANVFRVDGGGGQGWGQNLQLGWFAILS